MEDTVYRQAVLDALEWAWSGKTAIDAVKELPPAEPEQKWIPCSERMPEDNVPVLVSGKIGVYTAVHNPAGKDWAGWWKLNTRSHECNPLAWMPLPKPYEGKE